MSVQTYLRLTDPSGVYLKTIAAYKSLDYYLNCSGPSAMGILELTLHPTFDITLLRKHGRLCVMRSVNGRSPYLDNGAVYLIMTVRTSATEILIRAIHANWIMSTRIIAYDAGTAFTNKSATFADDMLKTLWLENFAGSISVVDRDGPETQADISAYVSVQANRSLGASIAEACTRSNFMAVAQRLCDASTTAGTYMTAEIFAPTESTLELRTYTVQRGQDHRVGTANQVILSETRGNLQNSIVELDYANEKTFIIAGGQGQQDLRVIATATDTARIGTSPFGRIEDFLDMSNTSDPTTLLNQAGSALWAGRPTRTASGTVIDTNATIRGIHYDLGDLVTTEDPRTEQLFDVRLDLIHEHIAVNTSQQGQSITTTTTSAGMRAIT